MTKDEAIKNLITISEILVSESKQHISSNEALDKIRTLIPCCDTIIPLLNEPRWHTGIPTEDGLYITHNVGRSDGVHYYSLSDFSLVHGWQTFGLEIVAWQKIEPFSDVLSENLAENDKDCQNK